MPVVVVVGGQDSQRFREGWLMPGLVAPGRGAGAALLAAVAAEER